MTFLKTFRFAKLLPLLAVVFLVSFKPVNCLLVVGVASKDFTCKRGGEAVAFPNVVGYQGIYHNNNDNYYNTANYVKALLRDKFAVPDKNITLYSSEKSRCVLIQYRLENKEWQCTLCRFAVGFGNNEEEALADAVSQKTAAVGAKVPYLKMESMGCPE
jgi:hypothetical protein